MRNGIAFTAGHFQAALASFFLNALLFSHLIEGFDLREAMPKALSNSLDFGSHSDVILFEPTMPSSPQNPATLSATKFVWWNSHHRLYGFPLPLACPVCRTVRPWKEFLSLPSGWTTECSNPGCGLRSDGSREQAAGKMSGTKPDGFAFVTPTKKRTSGWLSLDISSQFV